MASNARLFGDDLALSAILATDDPREQKCLDRHIRHFDHDFWQQECEQSVLRGNLAKSSQNDEIRLALGHIDQRRLPEVSPHDKLWGIGLSACDPESAQTPRQSVRHFGHDLLQKDCEHIVPRSNIATFSQKGEIRFALGPISERRLAEACPHDKLWCTGLTERLQPAPLPLILGSRTRARNPS